MFNRWCNKMCNTSLKSVSSGEIQNINFTENSTKCVRFISKKENNVDLFLNTLRDITTFNIDIFSYSSTYVFL